MVVTPAKIFVTDRPGPTLKKGKCSWAYGQIWPYTNTITPVQVPRCIAISRSRILPCKTRFKITTSLLAFQKTNLKIIRKEITNIPHKCGD